MWLGISQTLSMFQGNSERNRALMLSLCGSKTNKVTLDSGGNGLKVTELTVSFFIDASFLSPRKLLV